MTKTRKPRKTTNGEMQTLIIDGREFVVVARIEYDQLRIAANLRESDLPALPKADAHGNRPALEYARVSIARQIITARRAKGWTQQQLADAAGIRMETISRLEKAKNTADVATMKRIEKALQG